MTVGVLTLAAVVGAALCGILLPGYLRSPLLRYKIKVPAGEDLSGVEAGTPVLVGGLLRGRVLSVEDSAEGPGPAMFTVQFEIEPDPPMNSNVRARFVRDVVSSRSLINFTPISNADAAAVPLAEESDVLLNNEVRDASLFMTPAAERSFHRAWVNIERATYEWQAMRQDAESKLPALGEEMRRLRAEFDATYTGNVERLQALIDRFRAVGDRFETLRIEWSNLSSEGAELRDAFSQEGAWGRVRRSFTVLAERMSVASADGSSLATTIDGVARRWEDLKASGTSIGARFRELGDALSFSGAMADFSIAATELAEVSNHPLRTIAGIVFPNRSASEERRLAEDHLARQLLFGIEQARGAESALSALVSASDVVPATLDDLERMVDGLERLIEIEQALWQWRLAPSERE
jgi:hypothetical protein